MRLLKWLVALVAFVIVLALGVAWFAPDEVHVERSIVIDRPPADVFAIVNDYRRFNDWSPWAGKDPNAKYTLSGPPTGVGAKLAWTGDPDTVGSGWQEITASVPNERVETALDFGAQGKARAAFALSPQGAGTRVVWGFDSDFEGNLIGRLFGLVMERMLAPDYEAGLANLKRVVEAEPKPAAPLAPEPPAAAPIEAGTAAPASEGEAGADAAPGAGAASAAAKDDAAPADGKPR